MKIRNITRSFAVLFAGLLVGGTVVFFVTGKDVFLRLGFVGAIVVALLWVALLSIGIITTDYEASGILNLQPRERYTVG